MGKRTSEATKVTSIGLGVNLFLAVFKLLAGWLGQSGAMIADAVHSFSDLGTDFAVLVGLRLSNNPPDDRHRYGHGKYETLATAVIGVVLVLVGVGIFSNGLTQIIQSVQGEPLEAPGAIALIAALISIFLKELLFRRTFEVGIRHQKASLVANAWHHRSDALSSIAVALGVGGAILLGEEWRVLDPIAAVLVSFLILKVALGILFESLRELLEEALSEKEEKEILSIIEAFEEVSHPHNLRTRRIGSDVAIDVHIRVPGEYSVNRSHEITSQIEAKLCVRFGETTFISIHVEPTSSLDAERTAE